MVKQHTMQPQIYWIEYRNSGRLGIMSCPRGGSKLAHDISALRDAGVDVVVSLLTESDEFELDLLEEADLCMIHQIEFLAFPIVEQQVPLLDPETSAFMQTVANRLADHKQVVLHGENSIGRSALMAASVLVVQGLSVDDAFARIAAACNCRVPDTSEQRTWVEQFANAYNQVLDHPEKFASIGDVPNLWGTYDLENYRQWGQGSTHFKSTAPDDHQVVTLYSPLAQQLLDEARKRELDVETLVNQWLNEKLQDTTS
jgi:protein-tyrosine phosphatase